MIKWKYTKDEYPENDKPENDPYYPMTIVYMDIDNEYYVGWYNGSLFLHIDDCVTYGVWEIVKWAYLE